MSSLFFHVHTLRRSQLSISQKESPHKNLFILSSLSWTSSLHNCEKTSFYSLSHSVYGIFSQQPKQTETSGFRSHPITLMLHALRGLSVMVEHRLVWLNLKLTLPHYHFGCSRLLSKRKRVHSIVRVVELNYRVKMGFAATQCKQGENRIEATPWNAS